LKLRDLLQGRLAARPADEDLVGILEPGIEFEGRMSVASGIVRLNTHFKGEIHCKGTLVLAEQGEVEGEIHSKLVSIAGKVKGTVHAVERIEIKPHGVVLGDMYTASLIIEPGGYFEGQCHMPEPVPAGQRAESEQKT
jgi:cytoskeletal protein CcmA (bactofilin family)